MIAKICPSISLHSRGNHPKNQTWEDDCGSSISSSSHLSCKTIWFTFPPEPLHPNRKANSLTRIEARVCRSHSKKLPWTGNLMSIHSWCHPPHFQPHPCNAEEWVMKFSTFGQQYMLPQIRRPCKLWHPCGRVRSSTDKFTSLQINHLPRKPVLSSAKGMKDTNRRKSLD